MDALLVLCEGYQFREISIVGGKIRVQLKKRPRQLLSTCTYLITDDNESR